MELQIKRSGAALHISPLGEDHVTYRTPTRIWCVRADGALYARAYNGIDSRWYKAALAHKVGRIRAAGVTREVAFEPVEGAVNDAIDDGYPEKYGGSPCLNAMISPRACAATVRIVPRNNRSAM
ncbi:MAG TPA: DUF2255 family protein [Xanthobacteraceae bacterium]